MSPAFPTTLVGMAWYHREHYQEIKRIMADSDQLPDTYDKWFYQAEKTERTLKRRGLSVERVYVDPQTFPAWCIAKGKEMNGEARSVYASEFVGAEYRD